MNECMYLDLLGTRIQSMPHEYASRRISGDMQVDIHCNNVLLGAGGDGELKMAKHSWDEFEVSKVSCTSLSLYTSLLPQSV